MIASNLLITPAQHDDLEDASAILIAATHWMTSQGFYNWNLDWFTTDILEKYRAQAALYMVKDGTQNIATFRFEKDDISMWPEKLGETDAFYIHRIAVVRAHAGTGLTKTIIDWCKQTAKEQNRPLLRLDCADRPKLIEVYTRLGFERVGTIQWQNPNMPLYEGIKLELQV